ncbi:hypothetical protein DS745_23010 [Anaerobacillus alkaliphilus]|uniref:YhfM-like domain-containing protein n=1 Tax=Anaerobacillus alkaliphilus TaxID=1548597 RepID=A0A4Q0VNJ8_9BACI|nr:hypothetical protein [Anaerobacillus alkaliphilus]RXI96576.1 hypothetical protein DS745_23010 [Anaerobacillus alkaliphilus]
MRKLLVPLLLVVFTLVACNSEEVYEGVPYKDKEVIEIIFYRNWQAPGLLGFNRVRAVSSLRHTQRINDYETMVTLITIINKTKETNAFDVLLRNSDYDIILKFDDDTTKIMHLAVNDEGEKGLLVDNSEPANAFRIQVEDNMKIREVIEGRNN